MYELFFFLKRLVMSCYYTIDTKFTVVVCVIGEEIMSGGQRVHVPEVMEKRARECGIDVKTISTYIDSFK